MNNFAQQSATTVDIALELLRPYPVGISDSKTTCNFTFCSCFFETIFSIVFLISFELMFSFSDSKIIPVPGDLSISTSTFGLMPRVEPLPVAIAFTIDTAPWILAFTTVIKNHQELLVSWLHKELLHYAKFQML